MRVVNLVVLVVVMLLLAGGGYFAYKNHRNNLISATADQHESLVIGFTNAVWRFHNFKIMPLLSSGDKNLSENIDIAVFASDVTSYFRSMKIISVHVYSAQQQMLMSFLIKEGEQAIKPTNELLAKAVATGAPAADVVPGVYDRLLIQTVVPIIKNGKQELLMVITSDGSMENGAFMKLLGALLGGIAFAMMCIFLLNLVNMRRAENLIAKQYEENAELIEKANMANEENQQKSQFLANISHELRTPLNAIIGFSDILKNEFVPAPGQANHTNYINDIHSAGTHLLSLINDILDYSKAEAGKLELEVTEINAAKMIQNCIRLVQPRAEIAQVRVLDSLPKEAVTLVTDGKKFKQILLNLLSNAVKFTPTGGMVKVSCWMNMQDDMWVFEIRDTGIGISPKDISRAMSPFGQVDNALSRKFEGTGLGLPLTKKFVELMGGRFTIESELNKGTAVTFSLPRQFRPKEGVQFKQVG